MKTLREFINEQPEDRPIDFRSSEVKRRGDCGCILIHYGRDVFGLKGGFRAYFDVLYKGRKGFHPSDRAFAADAVRVGITKFPKTYGKLRKLLKTRATQSTAL